ncbi:MAG: hypothetical protein BWY66_01860 [bacterium ADurb.Bin374]|nr:MAG: hypothetical protein BWY66_01860 [bacterium ADurb.Bin374]
MCAGTGLQRFEDEIFSGGTLDGVGGDDKRVAAAFRQCLEVGRMLERLAENREIEPDLRITEDAGDHLSLIDADADAVGERSSLPALLLKAAVCLHHFMAGAESADGGVARGAGEEYGLYGISYKTVDRAAVLLDDGRHRGEMGVEHRENLGGRMGLAQRGEASHIRDQKGGLRARRLCAPAQIAAGDDVENLGRNEPAHCPTFPQPADHGVESACRSAKLVGPADVNPGLEIVSGNAAQGFRHPAHWVGQPGGKKNASADQEGEHAEQDQERTGQVACLFAMDRGEGGRDAERILRHRFPFEKDRLRKRFLRIGEIAGRKGKIADLAGSRGGRFQFQVRTVLAEGAGPERRIFPIQTGKGGREIPAIHPVLGPHDEDHVACAATVIDKIEISQGVPVAEAVGIGRISRAEKIFVFGDDFEIAQLGGGGFARFCGCGAFFCNLGRYSREAFGGQELVIPRETTRGVGADVVGYPGELESAVPEDENAGQLHSGRGAARFYVVKYDIANNMIVDCFVELGRE